MDRQFDWPAFLPDFGREAAARGFRRGVLAELAAGPLCVWERPAEGPRVYLSAGIHGDEPAGPLTLACLLRDGFFRPDVHWLLAPALNPDGLAASTRENAGGIDLNRDFLTRTAAEADAVAAWLGAMPAPALFLSLHEDCDTDGFYFYEINQGPDRPERAAAILDAVRPWFPPEPGPDIDGHAPRAEGWIYHCAEPDLPEGWPEAIFLAKAGCPLSFTFEAPSKAALPHRVAALRAAVHAAFRRWLETTAALPAEAPLRLTPGT